MCAIPRLGIVGGLAATLFLSTSVQSQYWETVIGGFGTDVARDIVRRPDGSYWTVGSTGSAGAGGDCYLVELGENGSLDWSTHFGGNGADGIRAIASCDSGFLLVGITNSMGSGGYDMLIVRVDTTGQIKWTRTWGGTEWDFANGAAFSGNGWIVVGESYSGLGTSSSGIVLRFDDDGNELWESEVGFASDDALHSVVLTVNGDVLVAGQTTAADGYSNGLLAMLSSTGMPLWSAVTNGDSTEVLRDCVATVEGNAVAVGYSFSNGIQAQVLLTCFDESGAEMWTQRIGQAGSFVGNALVQRQDSGFAVAGSISGFGAGGTDAYLLYADKDGNHEIGYTFGLDQDEAAWAIVHGSAGGYALAGSTMSYGNGPEDMHLISVDSTGTTQGAPVVVHFDAVGLSEQTLAQPIVHPNPVDGHGCIGIQRLPLGLVDLTVFDSSGRKVDKWQFRDDQHIQLEGFESGAYTLHARFIGSPAFTAVFVVL